jgi:tetratricopeptide (TPR) repeat protein
MIHSNVIADILGSFLICLLLLRECLMKLIFRFIATLCIVPVSFIAGTASAGTFSIGKSYSAECYDNAKIKGFGSGIIDACNRAIKEDALTPKDRASTFINRGIVRSYLNDLVGALEDYDKALSIKPDFAEAFANRGSVFIRMERYDDALVALNKALALELKKPERVYYNRAIVYEKQGMMRQAYEDLRKAVEIAPLWHQPKRELMRYQVVER